MDEMKIDSPLNCFLMSQPSCIVLEEGDTIAFIFVLFLLK
jgi:hypothetical protein